MRRLTSDEQRLLHLIAMAGGSWCPTQEERENNVVWLSLRSLERKRRLWVEPTDDGPRYHLTEQGMADAS